VPQVEQLSWIQILPLGSPALVPLVTDLGRGEAETIGLGLEHPGSLLILDDALARRIARLNELKFTGTLGVVVKAKQQGMLDAVRPVVTTMREAGFWLSDELVKEVFRQAEE
jgi:predicted nucleic acid-binding protein